MKVVIHTCMGFLKSSANLAANSTFSSFLSPVSLFDLEARLFVPTHSIRRSARAGAVKVGRRSGPTLRSIASRPYLDGREHADTLVVVGMTAEVEPASSSTDPCRELVFGGSKRTSTMMQTYASAAELRDGGAHSEARHNSHV